MTTPAPTSPYDDLAAFQQLPRLSGLALSPDGTRLVGSVSTLDEKGARFVSALWELDPAGERPARRLTRSAKGEHGPVFTSDGSVLFSSGRPAGEPDEDAPDALWALPPVGEARVAGTRPGGFGGVVAAHDAPVVVAVSDTLPGATDAASDRERRAARKDAGVTAVMHEGYPVRHWDRDLGAGQDRLLINGLPDDGLGEDEIAWRDLTPTPGRALTEAAFDVSPDGRTVVTTWRVPEPHGSTRLTLVAIDTGSGERRPLCDDPRYDTDAPRVSPDGTRVAFLRETRSSPSDPVDIRLVVQALDGFAEAQDAAPGWDRWVTDHAWAPTGNALLVIAAEGGRAPVFRVEDGRVTRLSTDDGHYSALVVSPDGSHIYAVRDAVDAPPAPVRLSAREPGGPTFLPAPPGAVPPPGRLQEVTATAEDGTALRAWLALPADGDPADLVVWVHGGPLSSWNGWSWRWNPWLLTARGYAVLLPDPGLSTGYGLAMVGRGWGAWGAEPYGDVMALTDAALGHPAVSPDRPALMGGSFGGYLANWVAGHTDWFAAIVTHASLWDLEQFGATTDYAYSWSREMTPRMTREHSPSRHADAIVTPMLVVHGDRDYRVPIGEGLRLWWDLVSRAEDPSAMPHRFLYFPDENHWVLTPQNARVWYETVLAFLAVHVRDEPWQVPDLLR